MSQVNQSFDDRLLAFDLRYANEAVVREELFIARQHYLIATKARAGQDFTLNRKLLDDIERYLASLNEWRRCILDGLDGH